MSKPLIEVLEDHGLLDDRPDCCGKPMGKNRVTSAGRVQWKCSKCKQTLVLGGVAWGSNHKHGKVGGTSDRERKRKSREKLDMSQ